nr:hypothetical protein [Tanacetum cinerariifolium]
MGDENHIRTLGGYSRPSYEGYRNTIELPEGNNVVPLRSDTIRLVQNGCSFYELRSEDPNKHLKDFLKLMDSLDLDGENRERTRMRLFQFPYAIKLAIGLNASQQDPSLHGRILLPNSLLNYFHREGRKTPQRYLDVPTTSWRIYIRSMDSFQGLTLKENPEQAFIEYAFSCTDEAGGLVSEFMASQDTRLSKFEADFKQQQREMTDKINTVLKAITYPIAGTLPSDTVKNPKLGTHPVSSTRSYPIIDPRCSSHPYTSINAIKAHFNDAIIEPQQTKELEPTLDDEFKDLHLNLPILKVLAHAPIYNAILDKYVESLELGKNESTFVQRETPAKMGDPGPFTLPCRLGDSEPFDTLTDGIVKDVVVHIGKLKLLNDFYLIDMKKDPETPLLVGRGFLATANAVIDCKMAKIAVGKGITRSIFSVKGIDLGAKPPYYARKDFIDCHFLREWEISRGAKLNPFKDTLVFRRMVEFLGAIPINLKCNMWELEDLSEKPIDWSKPPKNKDGAWNAKIRIIDPDGEEFTKILQSIPTTKKLSEKESPRDIINLDHFYDTNLRSVWLGSFHLFANVARFNRDTNANTSKKASSFNPYFAKPSVEKPLNGLKPSFTKAVKGLVVNKGHDVSVLVLARGLLNYEGDPVLVGCVRDFKSLPNIHTVCSNEGFSGLKISYLGGFWILLEFDSFQSCEKFQSNEGIKSWFSSLSQWTSNFEIQDRVVWIDIEGTPLRAWSQANFNKIARKWGELVHMDTSNILNKYSMRICVKTKVQHIITESFKVILEGKVSIVRAKEVIGWVPEFGEVNDRTCEEVSNVKPSNEPLDKLSEQAAIPSGDPFCIDNLIFKSSKIYKAYIPKKANTKLEFPPGFTPLNSNHEATVLDQAANNHSSVQSPKEASNNVVDEGITDSKTNNNSYSGSKQYHTASMVRGSNPANGLYSRILSRVYYYWPSDGIRHGRM